MLCYIICHDVLYQFLCIAHVWWVTIKIYLFTYLSVDKLFAKRDQQPFKAMCRNKHCLNHILLHVQKVCYSLRTSSQELIVHKLKQTRCSYLIRSLFDNIHIFAQYLLNVCISSTSGGWRMLTVLLDIKSYTISLYFICSLVFSISGIWYSLL